MRNSILLIRKHGQKKFELVSGPDSEFRKALDQYKEFARNSSHEEIAEVQFWEGDSGYSRGRVFQTKAQLAERDKAHKAAVESANKIESERIAASKKKESEDKAKAEAAAKQAQKTPRQQREEILAAKAKKLALPESKQEPKNKSSLNR